MSNCDTVELYINGVKVDKEPIRQYTNLLNPFFVKSRYLETGTVSVGSSNVKPVPIVNVNDSSTGK